MKYLITNVAKSKKGVPYATGLKWSDKAGRWCQVRDYRQPDKFTDAFLQLTDEQYKTAVSEFSKGLVVTVSDNRPDVSFDVDA